MRCGRRPGERLLQRAKIRDPAMLDHGLAVEIRGANGEHRGRLGDRGEPVGPIEAAPGQESHAAVLDAHMQPIAVPLDLVQPAVTRRHFVREARKTGFDELRERVLLCRRASSRAGNRSAAPRFDAFAELGGDAGARFARADSTAFGMRESNAELAIAFLPV